MKVYNIENLEVTTQSLQFDLSGNLIAVPLDQTASTVLPKATLRQLQIFELDPKSNVPFIPRVMLHAGLL